MCSITKNACMCNTILAAIEEALAVLVRDADVEDIDDDDVEHNLHAEKCAVDQKCNALDVVAKVLEKRVVAHVEEKDVGAMPRAVK